jgi:hypothetical protein
MTSKALASLACLPLIAGCTAVDSGFGDTVRHQIALQVIDPDPSAKTDVLEGSSGDRAARAVDRYRKGTIEDLKPVATGAGGPN